MVPASVLSRASLPHVSPLMMKCSPSSVGVAVVAPDGGRLDALIDRIRRYVDDNLEVEVCDVAVYYMESADE